MLLFQRKREWSCAPQCGTSTVTRPSPKGVCLQQHREQVSVGVGPHCLGCYLAVHTGTLVVRLGWVGLVCT